MPDNNVLIAPSILAADFGRLADELAGVATADWVHVDVMDGHFVPNITIGPMIVKATRAATSLFVDVHLMIENADRYIDDFVAAGADGITVHAEACSHLHRTVQQIKAHGKRVGVALNPATPVEAIEYVLADVDLVLAMTVNPGFGGQRFIDGVVPKIRRLREDIEAIGKDIRIQVDGGIKVDNVDIVLDAGADVIVSGSGIFGTQDYAHTIAAFRDRAKR